jgi:DNA excision repair protein ERCC-5
VLAPPDPDLREYQREMALSAITNRTTSKNPTRTIDRKSKSVPLFDLDDDDELLEEQPVLDYSEVNDDDLVAYAVQESFDASNFTKNVASTSQVKPTPSATRPISPNRDSSPEDDFYMDYPAPTHLETALSIANAAGTSRVHSSPSQSVPGSILFGKPTLLTGHQPQIPASPSSSDDEMEMVATSRVRNDRTFLSGLLQRPEIRRPVTPERPTSSSIVPVSMEESDDDDDMEEVPVPQAIPLHNEIHDNPPLTVASPLTNKSPSPSLSLLPPEKIQDAFQGPVIIPQDTDLNHDLDPLFIISRTPSPSNEVQDLRPSLPPIAEDWDAAEEMDVQAEEGEFARFISQVKGKDLGSVRKEIDDEIKALNEQRKAAMRDSEDITQQMVSQIMVWNMLQFSPLIQYLFYLF